MLRRSRCATGLAGRDRTTLLAYEFGSPYPTIGEADLPALRNCPQQESSGRQVRCRSWRKREGFPLMPGCSRVCCPLQYLPARQLLALPLNPRPSATATAIRRFIGGPSPWIRIPRSAAHFTDNAYRPRATKLTNLINYSWPISHWQSSMVSMYSIAAQPWPRLFAGPGQDPHEIDRELTTPRPKSR
jgi:hypothetical protein